MTNTPRRYAKTALEAAYGGRIWSDLNNEQRCALGDDLADMRDAEGFATLDDAAEEHARRVGGPDNLVSYADTLLAGKRRAERLAASIP